MPRLAAVLASAKRAGAPVNLEIKRIPGDPHYIAGDTAFATDVMDVVKAAGLDASKLIIQSFDPTNLEVAKQQLPGVVTSFLTTSPDPASVALCRQRGYDYLSPGGVPDAATMATAKRMGIKIVPYTLDTADDIRAAARAGVDAIITNDIPLARRTLGLTGTATSSPEPSALPSTPAAGTQRTKPSSLRLSLLATRRGTVVRRAAVKVRLTGRPGATVTVRVTTARGTLLAMSRIKITTARARTLRVRVTAHGRRVLAHSRRPLVVTARATLGADIAVSHRRLG